MVGHNPRSTWIEFRSAVERGTHSEFFEMRLDCESSDDEPACPKQNQEASRDATGWDVERLFDFDSDKLVGLAQAAAFGPAAAPPTNPGGHVTFEDRFVADKIVNIADTPLPRGGNNDDLETPTKTRYTDAIEKSVAAELERVKGESAFKDSQIERLRRAVCELLIWGAAHWPQQQETVGVQPKNQVRAATTDSGSAAKHSKARALGTGCATGADPLVQPRDATGWDVERLFDFDVDTLVGLARVAAGGPAVAPQNNPGGHVKFDDLFVADEIVKTANTPSLRRCNNNDLESPTITRYTNATKKSVAASLERVKRESAFKDSQIERLRRAVCELLLWGATHWPQQEQIKEVQPNTAQAAPLVQPHHVSNQLRAAKKDCGSATKHSTGRASGTGRSAGAARRRNRLGC